MVTFRVVLTVVADAAAGALICMVVAITFLVYFYHLSGGCCSSRGGGGSRGPGRSVRCSRDNLLVSAVVVVVAVGRASIDHFDDGVRNGELSALTVDGLARVGARVRVLNIRHYQNTMSALARRAAPRSVARVTPVQTPVNVRYGKSTRGAFDFERLANANHYASHWRSRHFRWCTSVFVTAILTI